MSSTKKSIDSKHLDTNGKQNLIFYGKSTDRYNLHRTITDDAIFIDDKIDDIFSSTFSSTFQNIVVTRTSPGELIDRQKDLITKNWIFLHSLLVDGGTLTIQDKFLIDVIQNMHFNELVEEINRYFVLTRVSRDQIMMQKVDTLHPEIVAPKDLNDAIEKSQPLNILFNKSPDKFVCQLESRTDRKLGAGIQGAVYSLKEWKSDVVIKRVKTRIQYRPNPVPIFSDPVNGNYSQPLDVIEILASSVLGEIANGQHENFFSLHFPRYSGYFICPSIKYATEDQVAVIYLIIEKLEPRTLIKYLDSNISDVELKTVVWQSIFAIITMNRAGWSHQDSSDKNFLLRNVEDIEWRGVSTKDVDYFSYELDGKEFKVKKTKYIPVLTDFGFGVREIKPKIEASDIGKIRKDFRAANNFRKGFDVNYFMATLLMHRTTKFDLLFKRWLELLNDSVTEQRNKFYLGNFPNDITSLKNHMNTGSTYGFGTHAYGKLLELATGRVKEPYDHWDPTLILTDSYFDDIMV